jgi:hypothetical protein
VLLYYTLFCLVVVVSSPMPQGKSDNALTRRQLMVVAVVYQDTGRWQPLYHSLFGTDTGLQLAMLSAKICYQ